MWEGRHQSAAWDFFLWTKPYHVDLCFARYEQQLHGWRGLQQHGQQQYGQHAEPQLHSFLSWPPPYQHLDKVPAFRGQSEKAKPRAAAVTVLSDGDGSDACSLCTQSQASTPSPSGRARTLQLPLASLSHCLIKERLQFVVKREMWMGGIVHLHSGLPPPPSPTSHPLRLRGWLGVNIKYLFPPPPP